MGVHSTLENYNYRYWPKYAVGAIETCNESEPVSGTCIYIYRDKGKIGDYIGEGNCFFINYDIGQWIYVDNYQYQNDKITITNIHNEFQVPAGNFLNAIEIYENGTLIEHNQPTKHYFVKNIGLIRKELVDSNQVWNLVNYHIEQ
jgi:hypothetical protein